MYSQNNKSTSIFITDADVDIAKVYPEDSLMKYSAFASDLGMPIGQPPELLRTNLGNGQAFHLSKVNDNIFLYNQAFGSISLLVFND